MLVRAASAAAVVVAAVVIAVVLLTGGSRRELDFRFVNASQLVKGDQIKVGGVPVGSIKEIELTDDGQALVKSELTDDAPVLREGTTARIGIASLSSVANRFIELTPAKSGPELPDGATLPTTRTTSQVELDSVLNALDEPTRKDLQGVARGGATAFGQPGAKRLNKTFAYLNPALSRLDAIARELGRDRGTFSRFLVRSAAVVGTVANRDADVDRTLVATATTARTLADRRAELSGILRNAPGSLGELETTVNEVGTTARAILPQARKLRRVAPQAAALIADAQPLLRDAPGALDDVDAVLPDLRVALRRLPTLQRAATPAFAALSDGLTSAQPIVDGLLPYLPDIYHGVVTGFGGAQVQSYDANGLYARIQPIVGSASVLGLANGLLNLPPIGQEAKLTNRCPGGAYERARDGSSPVVTGGCDEGQTPK